MSTFLIVSIIWVASEILLARTKISNKQASKKDKFSLRIIWITIFLSIFIGFLFRYTGLGFIHIGANKIHYLGLALIVSGLFFRWFAIIKLKSMFTVDVSIQKDHKIIKSGIYKSIRHPSYLGSLLSFLGLGIALVNWISLLLIFIPIFLAFNHRIKIEEKVLIDEFGEEYLNYSKDTYRLVPGIY